MYYENKISENDISMTGKLPRLPSERVSSMLTKFSTSQKYAQIRNKFVREILASIYLFKSIMETPEQCMKSVQCYGVLKAYFSQRNTLFCTMIWVGCFTYFKFTPVFF